MAFIDEDGYVTRRIGTGKSVRNWWLLKKGIQIGNISVREKDWGKRCRFKVEVVE